MIRARSDIRRSDTFLSHGKDALENLPRLMDNGSLEERKEFIRAFIAGIIVRPDEDGLDVHMQ